MVAFPQTQLDGGSDLFIRNKLRPLAAIAGAFHPIRAMSEELA
jgi:hypothetical protein